MTVIDEKRATGAGAHPTPLWAAGGPDGPGGTDGKSSDWLRRPRRRRALAVSAVAVIAAGAGGGIAYATARGSATLTTAQVTATTDPAVVDVVSVLGYEHGTSAGTGIVLTATGEVLTNNHVVEGATSIKVTDVGNGRTYKAVVVGYDTTDDIAVLQLQHASGLKTATLGNSSAVEVGDAVVGIGNAGGRGGRPSAVTGKVTALGQSVTASDEVSGTSEHLTGMIRTNANVQAGDSGGPLVNIHGQVIGIDTAGSSRYQLGSQHAQAQAYAIPVNKAISITDQIEAGRSSATVHIGNTAFLGVEVVSSGPGFEGLPDSTGSGVTVAGVVSGSPAARAGLHTGDQITSVGGHKVTSPTGIQDVLERYHPGNKISVSWADQAGHTHAATVVLVTGPAA
jgi:S1-C subfamily serine protease